MAAAIYEEPHPVTSRLVATNRLLPIRLWSPNLWIPPVLVLLRAIFSNVHWINGLTISKRSKIELRWPLCSKSRIYTMMKPFSKFGVTVTGPDFVTKLNPFLLLYLLLTSTYLLFPTLPLAFPPVFPSTLLPLYCLYVPSACDVPLPRGVILLFGGAICLSSS